MPALLLQNDIHFCNFAIFSNGPPGQQSGSRIQILGSSAMPRNALNSSLARSSGTLKTKCEHYPLDKPNDDVASEIPEHIRADFKEALRCRWVDACNATTEMCRRAVQASCIQLGAPANNQLVKQIDWLSANGIITNPLKEMAHRIRLGGNLGAHPPEDPDDPTEILIGSEYADAVLEFTRDFFQHVYVTPERLKKYTFKKLALPATGP